MFKALSILFPLPFPEKVVDSPVVFPVEKDVEPELPPLTVVVVKEEDPFDPPDIPPFIFPFVELVITYVDDPPFPAAPLFAAAPFPVKVL